MTDGLRLLATSHNLNNLNNPVSRAAGEYVAKENSL